MANFTKFTVDSFQFRQNGKTEQHPQKPRKSHKFDGETKGIKVNLFLLITPKKKLVPEAVGARHICCSDHFKKLRKIFIQIFNIL